MTGRAVFFRLAQSAGMLWLVGNPCSAALASGAQTIKTNFVERWVTNTIEVNVPVNRFVSEYHTNWSEQVVTNIVRLYTTNVLNVYRTNHLNVEQLRTNFVTAYQTNLKVLNLTNWMTVVAFKTNWIAQPLTNVVEIDLPKTSSSPAAAAPAVKPSPAPKPNAAETPLAIRPLRATDALVVEATRTARRLPGNQVEVHLKARWKNGTSPLRIQQWRIEAGEGSFLTVGQDQEMTRVLKVGQYKVEAKAQPDSQGNAVVGRVWLTVTVAETVVSQK